MLAWGSFWVSLSSTEFDKHMSIAIILEHFHHILWHAGSQPPCWATPCMFWQTSMQYILLVL